MSLTLAEANRAVDASLAKRVILEITVSVSVCDAAAQIEPFAGCSALPHLRPVRLRLSPSWGEAGNDPT